MTDHDDLGPAPYPPPARRGLGSTAAELLQLPADVLRAGVALARLPLDLVVLLGYTVRQAPLLIQDVRSLVNDVARLVHHGEQEGALKELLDELARAARAESAGALAHFLRASGDLAAVQAELERRRLAAGEVGTEDG